MKCNAFHFQMSYDLSVTDEGCRAGSPIRALAEVINIMRMGHSTQKVTPFTQPFHRGRCAFMPLHRCSV